MKVCVLGLWHLGTVTAAALASGGHEVTGLDFEPEVVAGLDAGKTPLFEPGLESLVKAGLAGGRLHFTTDVALAVRDADAVWVAYDTPVDDDDRADVQYVIDRVARVLPHLPDGALVLVSSQVPVGTTRRLEQMFAGYGKTAKIPMLWIYAENDLYFGPKYPREWHEAFAAAGGHAEFVQFPPHGENGHLLFTQFPEVWQPKVAQFLQQQGFKPPAGPLVDAEAVRKAKE